MPDTKTVTLRPEVTAFAEAMEERLCENDHKGGWGACTFDYLLRRLREEVGELVVAYKRGYPKAEIRMEAADCANFALMIADRFGDL